MINKTKGVNLTKLKIFYDQIYRIIILLKKLKSIQNRKKETNKYRKEGGTKEEIYVTMYWMRLLKCLFYSKQFSDSMKISS